MGEEDFLESLDGNRSEMIYLSLMAKNLDAEEHPMGLDGFLLNAVVVLLQGKHSPRGGVRQGIRRIPEQRNPAVERL